MYNHVHMIHISKDFTSLVVSLSIEFFLFLFLLYLFTLNLLRTFFIHSYSHSSPYSRPRPLRPPTFLLPRNPTSPSFSETTDFDPAPHIYDPSVVSPSRTYGGDEIRGSVSHPHHHLREFILSDS